jgi:ferrochelatase
MRFAPEPAYTHGTPSRPGLLLANLGTPDEPTPAALRRYLAEFLWDPRVVEIPRPVWWLILHGVILRVRPAKSAAKYRAIWMPEGSPLLVHTRRQADLLRGYLGERLKRAGLPADGVPIEVGMRYGEPSVASALAKLRAAGVDRLLVLPLYPQYAASTTASVCDAVFAELGRMRFVPALRTVSTYHDDPGYIRALANQVGSHWEKSGRPDRLVMSFHGLPRFSLDKGDPYHCLCQKTGRLLAEELGLKADQYVVSFQSRFGRAEWLKPYTQPTLEALGKAGVASVDVVCPGFPSDCLETLEEIAIECRDAFLAAGGRQFRYIPCLNESPAWLSALTDLAMRHLQGWLVPPPDEAARALQAARARNLGARA